MNNKISIGLFGLLMSLLTAATSVLLPLYFSDSLSLVRTGSVLACMSLTFLTVRTVLAYFADSAKKKHILIGAALTSALSCYLYRLAATAGGFVNARLMEGVRQSCFWAANRGAAMEAGGSRGEAAALVTNVGSLMSIGAGLGTILGMRLAEESFDVAFNFLIGVSFLAFIVILFYREKPAHTTHRHSVADFVAKLKSTPKKTWQAGLYVAAFDNMASATLTYFALPLFFSKALGFSFFQIGVLFALLYLSSGIVSAINPNSLRRKGLFMQLSCAAHAILVAIAFGLIDKAWVIAAMALLGFGYGIARKLFEQLIFVGAGDSPCRNLHIAVLHVPMRVFEIVAYLIAGAIAQYFGYTALLIYPLIFYAYFASGTRKMLGQSKAA